MSKKCKCGFFEEIHGFQSFNEYENFLKYLEEQVKKQNIKKVQEDKNYEKGLIYGGTWYKCSDCNEIWRIVEPDFPFKGLWEKVNI